MKTHIVLIGASAAKDSHTTALLTHIATLLEKQEVKTTVLDLAQNPLPFLAPEFHEKADNPSLISKEFIALVRGADGIVLGTPTYHGSFSGVLKNALDILDSDSFKDKFVGLVNTAGGARNTQAFEHLRSIVRTLYGYTIQTQVSTSSTDFAQSAGRLVVSDKGIQDRCVRFVEELLLCTALLKNKIPPNSRQDFMQS